MVSAKCDSALAVEVEREEDGRWLAEVTALPGVLAYGGMPEEARARAEALASRVMADRRERSEPAAAVVRAGRRPEGS